MWISVSPFQTLRRGGLQESRSAGRAQELTQLRIDEVIRSFRGGGPWLK
jgi:hypothetical protein